ASKADEGALELRGAGGILVLVEREEHHSLFRVVSGHLEHVAATDPPHSDAIVEEERARILLVDLPPLETRAREHEQLRIDREFQRVERRLQIAALAVEGERE